MSVPALVHPPLPERLSEAREALFSVLQHNYAIDRIDMDEFERRMEAVEAALDHTQLESIRTDLFPAETTASSSQHALVKVAPDHVPATSRTLSMFGGGSLRGVFRLPQRSSYVSVLGGASLDLREAEFSTLPHELHIYSVLGGAEIIIPPGVNVEILGGINILGGVEHNLEHSIPLRPDAPTIRLYVWSLLGGVQIDERYPGESERDAKRRRKRRQKALRMRRQLALREAGSRERG